MKSVIKVDGEEIGKVTSVEIERTKRPSLYKCPVEEGWKLWIENFEEGDKWDLYIGEYGHSFELVSKNIDRKSIIFNKDSEKDLKLKAGFGESLGNTIYI